jgi:hypothetical protein
MDVMNPRSDEALARAKTKGGCVNLKDQVRAKLNPLFVEWLMGLPHGWTDFAPVEMESWLSRQRSLLQRLLGG